MTTRFVVVVFLLIVAAYAADRIWNGGTAALFMAERTLDLVETLTFWR